MHGYVINLERRPDRKERFLGWNADHGVGFTFVPAVEGKAQSRAALVEAGLLAPEAGLYTDGAIGNALSHWQLWRACAEGDLPMLVFEDDACLRKDFLRLAQATLSTAGNDWDIFYLGYNTDASIAVVTPEALFGVIAFDEQAKRQPGYFDKFAKAAPEVGPPAVFKMIRAFGTLAYLITPAGAQRLLKACFPLTSAEALVMHGENRSLLPTALDSMILVAIQKGLINARCCFPPLVTGPNGDSDVQPAR